MLFFVIAIKKHQFLFVYLDSQLSSDKPLFSLSMFQLDESITTNIIAENVGPVINDFIGNVFGKPELQVVKKEMMQLQSEIKNLESQINSIRTENIDLKGNVSKLESKIVELGGDKDVLAEAIFEMQSRLDSISEHRNDNQTKLTCLTKERNKLLVGELAFALESLIISKLKLPSDLVFPPKTFKELEEFFTQWEEFNEEVAAYKATFVELKKQYIPNKFHSALSSLKELRRHIAHQHIDYVGQQTQIMYAIEELYPDKKEQTIISDILKVVQDLQNTNYSK